MTPIGQLSSWLFANLWWIVGIAGVMFSIGAAWLTRGLYQRREQALALADDNARLYDEQRHIAETLQLSLLPQVLVPPPGGHVTARYWPAGEASLIGGDFYDAFRVDADRWGVVIGDVCGKGIDAAAITGLVRHTVRAAARNATSPAEVLRDVHLALSDHQPSTFCTVCFFYVTVAADGSQSLTIALGGHPSPVLRSADGAVREIGEPGSLLGIFEPVLIDTTVPVAPGDTVVLYTDGLTDAPADQAVPIEELFELLAAEGDEPVELLADSIRPLKRRRRPRGSNDDTAILVLRFGVPARARRARCRRRTSTPPSQRTSDRAARLRPSTTASPSSSIAERLRSACRGSGHRRVGLGAEPEGSTFGDVVGELSRGLVGDDGVAWRQLEDFLGLDSRLQLASALELGVELGTEQQRRVGEPEPEEEHDRSAQ